MRVLLAEIQAMRPPALLLASLALLAIVTSAAARSLPSGSHDAVHITNIESPDPEQLTVTVATPRGTLDVAVDRVVDAGGSVVLMTDAGRSWRATATGLAAGRYMVTLASADGRISVRTFDLPMGSGAAMLAELERGGLDLPDDIHVLDWKLDAMSLVLDAVIWWVSEPAPTPAPAPVNGGITIEIHIEGDDNDVSVTTTPGGGGSQGGGQGK